MPAGWTARERTGIGGALPYLSDPNMSVALHLVARPAGGTIEDGLELAERLSGGGTEVFRSASGGAAAWDQGSGQLHTISAGYVGSAHIGVVMGTVGFCSHATAFTADEGQALVALLQAVVDSYR